MNPTIAYAPVSQGFFPTQVANTQVLIGNGTGAGVAAPMIYASSTQVAAIVPYEVLAGTATVQVQYQGQTVASESVGVAASSPGVFRANNSGLGQAAALNQDMSPNSASNPAAPGSIIVLYASGEGQTSPGGVDGEIAGTSAPQPVQRVLVSIGTAGAQILYAGGVPGLVASVIQVNARIPLGTGPANLPVTITVGSANSQVGITIAVSK